MGVLHGNPFLIASGSPTEPAVPLQRSVRLRSSASAYFSRTPATATNKRTYTISVWVKKSGQASYQTIMQAYNSTNVVEDIRFQNDNTISFGYFNGGNIYALATTQVFRDPSAWYHIVGVVDSTNATSTERVRLYVNGVRITAFSTAVYPAQNTEMLMNANIQHLIGANINNGLQYHVDGYLTEFNFIDGQALTPSSFGGYNAGTNVWEVRKYSGTYGTNGYYLPFTNPASIGADNSGNSNNWTPNNIQTSNSALTSYDSMFDVPTNTGGNNANFATLNPLANAGTLSAGNLTTTGGDRWSISTIGMSSGKWYAEVTITTVGTESSVGIATRNWLSTPEQPLVGNLNTASWGYWNNGNKANNTNSAYGASYTTGDVIGIALDVDAGTLTFYKNNVSQGVAFTGLPSSTYFFAVEGRTSGTANNCSINFGQRPFSYTPPSGFKSLNTFNLPEPTIPRGDKYFKQYLYTGNGGGLQIGEIQKPASLFNLDRSVRIRATQNAYFSRLPTVNGNGQKFTISTWIKRGKIGTGWTDTIFTGRTGTNFPEIDIMFSTDLIKLQAYTTGAALLMNVDTVNLYRNTGIWYHVVTAFDTTQTTPADRVKVYVNGVAQTIAAGATYPSINLVLNANQTVTQYIGSSPANTAWGDLYFADYYMIDGQQLLPTDFGVFDGNNYWTPKAYTGTYGTNGFHLEFEDYSAATAAAIGKDTSGNSNNFTPTGINVTVPANTNVDWDSMVDVPTLTSTDSANFCTLNPLLVAGGTTTYSKGNLNTSTAFATTYGKPLGTIPISAGKWYWETTIIAVGGAAAVGIGNGSAPSTTTGLGGAAGEYTYTSAAQKYNNNVLTSYGATYTTNDIIGVAYDADVGTIEFYKNGTSQGIAFTGINGIKYAGVSATGPTASQYALNFGQRPFRYTVPTGFKSLNSFNVAEVTGDVESPDLVRIKSRSATTAALWFNSVSGVGKHIVGNNSTAGEVTDPNSIIQFNKNGLLIGNNANINTSAATYIADVWKAGDTIVTNTAGSISSQVRANPISGVSIVSWAGNNSAATIGHGLGVAPSMIIWKYRTATSDWAVGHKMLNNGSSPWSYWLQLQTTARDVASAGPFNNTAPTSSVFSVGSFNNLNTMVAFCFAEIPGFSKMDRYLSNGSSTDGPFVYTGFRPRFVMIKQADAARSWIMYDTTRNPTNVTDKYFFMEGLNNNEQTAALLDITSNGFKLKNNNVNTNTTAGSNYIYMAFAENPFKYALAR